MIMDWPPCCHNGNMGTNMAVMTLFKNQKYVSYLLQHQLASFESKCEVSVTSPLMPRIPP